MILRILLITALFVPSVQSQTIYKVVKEDGTVLYTDVPQDGAETLEFEANTKNVADSPDIKATQKTQSRDTQPDYKVSITSPEPEATIRNNNGQFSITAATTPAFRGRYRLTFDGQPTRINSSGKFNLTGIDRGAHTYHIDIIDNKGKTLASSPQQTLYLHQASVFINNN